MMANQFSVNPILFLDLSSTFSLGKYSEVTPPPKKTSKYTSTQKQSILKKIFLPTVRYLTILNLADFHIPRRGEQEICNRSSPRPARRYRVWI